MAIDITEKQLDILVNGSQQASYDQRANSANYDVSVSSDDSFNWNVLYSGTTTQNITHTTNATGGWYYMSLSYDSDNFDGDSAKIIVDGSIVIEVSEGGNNEILLDIASGATIESSENGSLDYTYSIERAANHTKITDRLGNTHRIPTGISVSGVTQS